MAEDSELVKYILKHRQGYTLDQLEASLVEQGLDAEAVARAIAEVRSREPAEIPDLQGGGALGPDNPLGGASPGAETVKLTLFGSLPNGIMMLTAPGDYFRRMEKEGGYMGPMWMIIHWAVATSLVVALMDLKRGGSIASLVGILITVLIGGVPASIIAPIPVMIYTVAFYLLCTVNGGKGSFEASFRAAASLTPLMPLTFAVGGLFPLGLIPLFLYGLLLSIYAGAGVHGLSWWRSFFSHVVFLIGGIVFLVVRL